MTNKERYQRAFSVLHASEIQSMEVTRMKKENKSIRPRLIAVCAATALVLALATAAYAADVGGIQRTIQVWVHGDQTDAVLEIGEGEYTLTYQDESGEEHTMGGGGVAIDPFGRERPLTEEELMKHLYAPNVEYEADGSVWVYWYDQKIEITDKFEDGICYVQLKSGDKTLYVTVKYDNGFAYGPHGYTDPRTFN